MAFFRRSLFLSLLFSMSIGLLDIEAKKEAQTLGERVHELMEMSFKRAVIRLKGNMFRLFIKATPRNYSFIVMFTDLSSHGKCIVCRYAYDEFRLVANSWWYTQFNANNLFFGMVDFDDGPHVFRSLGMNSVPVFMHFPEKGKPKKGDQMDTQWIGFQAETIAEWIAERTDIQIEVLRSPNYSHPVGLLVCFSLIVTFLYKKRNNLDFLYSKTSWGLAALFIVFAMTSGQMWNHIFRPPFINRSPRGTGIFYIHRSSIVQLIMESYIVFFLNFAITRGMILMLEAAAPRGGSKKKSKIRVIVGLALVVIFFSLLSSIFRIKSPDYPFSL